MAVIQVADRTSSQFSSPFVFPKTETHLVFIIEIDRALVSMIGY